MAHEVAAHGLAHAHKKPIRKHLKTFHVKELHDGTFSHEMTDGKGGTQSGSAPDLDQVHDALQAHMGAPNADVPPEAEAVPA